MSAGAKSLTWTLSNVAQLIHKFVIFVSFCQRCTTHALPATLAPLSHVPNLTFYRLWLSYRKIISDYYQAAILYCRRKSLNCTFFKVLLHFEKAFQGSTLRNFFLESNFQQSAYVCNWPYSRRICQLSGLLFSRKLQVLKLEKIWTKVEEKDVRLSRINDMELDSTQSLPSSILRVK